MVFALIVITLLFLTIQLARWAVQTPDQPQNKPQDTSESMAAVPIDVIETTTTTAPPATTTTEVLRTTTTRANRGTPRTTATGGGHDFWWRLANCESEVGRTSRNIFQFSPDTAAKVGIDGSESYEVQRAAAIAWAARIHPREGSTSGWPHCWWVALAGE